jgi:hypothetical protein
MVCAQEHTMKTGLNHAVRVTVAALSIVLGLGAAEPAAAQCQGDVTANGVVDGEDLAMLLAAWDKQNLETGADIDQNGVVNGEDLAMFLSVYGRCGPIRAWGNNTFGQCNVPPDLGPCTTVAGVSWYTIALRTDGTVRAWGENPHGQCDVPTDLGPCTAIAGGWAHTIALRTDGSVRAWGDNSVASTVPTNLGPCTAISSGSYHCVVFTP